MEKWIRRGIQAALTAGAVGVASVGAAQADTTNVAPRTVSETVSVAGSNGILVGNSVSVPVVIPITDNKVAVTGIGAAINGENALISAGILGNAHACQSGGDSTNVSPFVRSSSTSVVGDNHIGSGNSISVPIVAPVTGNDVAVAGIGAAANVVDLVAALGILGNASAGDCDEDGDGDNGNGGYGNGKHTNGKHAKGGKHANGKHSDGGYGNGNHAKGGKHAKGKHGNGGYGNGGYGESGYGEHGAGDSTTVAGKVKSESTSVVGDNSILSGNSVSLPVYAPITGNDVAVAGIGGAVNADSVTAALGILGNASAGEGSSNGLLGGVASLAGLPSGQTEPANAELSDASLHSAGDSTVVAPEVKSKSTSVVGDNSIGSGNSVSAPVTVPVTDNKVAVAGIGGAVNGEDVDVAAGVLGNAEVEDSGSGGEETVVAPKVKSSSTSVVGDNSILSGNSVSAPVTAPVTDNDVAVAGIGGAVNAEDVTIVGSVLGTASALLGG